MDNTIQKLAALNGLTQDDLEPGGTPTQADRIEAQVMYTALMTDTLLEED